MDSDQILDQNAPAGLEVGPAAMDHLRLSAKWAKFLAILGFIGVGFMVVLAVAMLGFDSFAKSIGNRLQVGLIYLVFAVVYFFPMFYLYRFADRTQEALASRSSRMLTEGLENLSNHYQFIGILTAIFLGLMVLVLLFVGVTVSMFG